MSEDMSTGTYEVESSDDIGADATARADCRLSVSSPTAKDLLLLEHILVMSMGTSAAGRYSHQA
jgi:hypothetical protein